MLEQDSTKENRKGSYSNGYITLKPLPVWIQAVLGFALLMFSIVMCAFQWRRAITGLVCLAFIICAVLAIASGTEYLRRRARSREKKSFGDQRD
jgi:hypothetical protein